MRFNVSFFTLLILLVSSAISQDSVQVVFRYIPSSSRVIRVFVPGTFNNWGPNSNGRIQTDAPSRMTFNDSLGFYFKTGTFRAGDTPNYKFHEHYNGSGSDWAWFTDPLNPEINTSDNNNSILNVESLMIFQVYPQPETVLSRETGVLSAGIFTASKDSLDLEKCMIIIDDTLQYRVSDYMISDCSLLYFPLAALKIGTHKAVISVESVQGRTLSKTTSFTLTGKVFFQTPSQDSVFAERKTVRWQVNMEQSTVEKISLQTINGPAFDFSPRSDMNYAYTVSLKQGINQYLIRAVKSSGDTVLSDTLALILPERQKPLVDITISVEQNSINLNGSGVDEQDTELDYQWQQQPLNTMTLPGVDGHADSLLTLAIPPQPGHYAFKLTVTDSDSNQNSKVHFFTVLTDGSVDIPLQKTAPSWVQNTQIYSLFLLAFTEEGTLQSAIPRLQYIRDLGYNVIWLLPVMQVEGGMDQRYNIGYNIVDFYAIDPVYGTAADFKEFVDAAHDLGLRVILDVTPNHSSRSHAMAMDVREKGLYSRYYDFYQHEIIPHNDNGLGQSVSSDGIVYYSGFSDALLNWNWSDAEARAYMLEVYKYWLCEFDIDGYRLDVYWGPHRRYGRYDFDIPLRRELRSAKSDILILGETHGTGPGSEIQYADYQGGMDMGYDWSLSGRLYSFPSISSLHSGLRNGGYRPGENSFFMRFLENHDELRVAYRYESLEKTKPVSAALSLSTGIPMIYQGQEVGMGYDMQGDKEFLARSDVVWNGPGACLQSHYQLLSHIRNQFAAFKRQYSDTNADGNIDDKDKDVQPRLEASSSYVYAFARPFLDQNGVVLLNFSDNDLSVDIPLELSYWAEFSTGFSEDSLYYLNRLDQNQSSVFRGRELDTLTVNLDAFGKAVYTISKSRDSVGIQNVLATVYKQMTVPSSFSCSPGYPNPFNSSVMFEYLLPQTGKIEINIYNVLGQKVRSLVKGQQSQGFYSVNWNGQTDQSTTVPSGIYLVETIFNKQKHIQRICLIR